MKFKSIILSLAASAMLFTSCNQGGSSNAENGPELADASLTTKKYFTMEDGDLVRPTGYRSWVFVGTPVTPNDLNNGKAAFPEMHNVYIDPVSYEHYKQTGKWREGTILVKELVSVGATQAVSGNGYFEGEFIGLEAELKSKEHYPDEPGNWAIFSFTQPKTGVLKDKATAFPYAACAACHDASAQDDFVFTQYYPVLRAAKSAGDGNPEDVAQRTAENGEKKKDDDKVAMGMMDAPGIWDPTAPTPTDKKFDIPVEEKALFDYLNSGKYKTLKYREEGEPHRSAGPHEYVRTFWSDNLAESVEAGNDEHPIGSYAIKEQYKDGKQFGWSVMLKTQAESDGGNGWFWYEVTDRNDIKTKAALGNNVRGCVACHTVGNDMVRSRIVSSL